MSGRYNAAKHELLRARGADIDKAIIELGFIAREDPTYRDSLTLLGMAYYRKGRYQDAFQVIQRALGVNKGDEIAWLLLGLTQLRLGNAKGLESIKGGLTLLTKAMQDGYKGFDNWDLNRTVHSSLRRSIVLAMKDLEEKEKLIRSVEVLIARIGDEELFQQRERGQGLYDDQPGN